MSSKGRPGVLASSSPNRRRRRRRRFRIVLIIVWRWWKGRVSRGLLAPVEATAVTLARPPVYRTSRLSLVPPPNPFVSIFPHHGPPPSAVCDGVASTTRFPHPSPFTQLSHSPPSRHNHPISPSPPASLDAFPRDHFLLLC